MTRRGRGRAASFVFFLAPAPPSWPQAVPGSGLDGSCPNSLNGRGFWPGFRRGSAGTEGFPNVSDNVVKNCSRETAAQIFMGGAQFNRHALAAGPDRYHLHTRCFAAWEFERTKAEGASG